MGLQRYNIFFEKRCCIPILVVAFLSKKCNFPMKVTLSLMFINTSET